MPPTLVLLAVGGSSGVGKTTVLAAAEARRDGWPYARLSTGTFFTEALALQSRDAVRSAEWPEVEEDVADAMALAIREQAPTSGVIVLDTHFGAKTSRGTYRIGLQADLITRLANAAQEAADSLGRLLALRVAVVETDPHELLRRRRMDKTRDRELSAVDCFNGLRENRRFGPHYASAFRQCSIQATRFRVIANDDLTSAVAALDRFSRT